MSPGVSRDSVAELLKSSSLLERKLAELRAEVEVVNAKFASVEKENSYLKKKIKELEKLWLRESRDVHSSHIKEKIPPVLDKIPHSTETVPHKKRKIDDTLTIKLNARDVGSSNFKPSRKDAEKSHSKHDSRSKEVRSKSNAEQKKESHHRHKYKDKPRNHHTSGASKTKTSHDDSTEPNETYDAPRRKTPSRDIPSSDKRVSSLKSSDSEREHTPRNVTFLGGDDAMSLSKDKTNREKPMDKTEDPLSSKDKICVESNINEFYGTPPCLLENKEIGAEVVITNESEISNEPYSKRASNINKNDEFTHDLLSHTASKGSNLSSTKDNLSQEMLKLESDSIEPIMPNCIVVDKFGEISRENNSQLTPSIDHQQLLNNSEISESKKFESLLTKTNSNTFSITIRRRPSKIIKG